MNEPSNAITIVYDDDCPLCSSYIKHARLSRQFDDVRLVNARDGGELVDRLYAQHYDLDEGMAVVHEGEIYFGPDAVHFLSMITTPSGLINRLLGAMTKTRAGAKLVYPALKAGRAVSLFALGRPRLRRPRRPVD